MMQTTNLPLIAHDQQNPETRRNNSFARLSYGLMLFVMALVFWKISGAWLVAVTFGGLGITLLWLAWRNRFQQDNVNLALIWAASLATIWPLLQNRMLITHDLDEWHLVLFNQFDRLLQQGAIYPRWAEDLQAGHGGPLLNFFPPAWRYLAESLHFLGFSFSDSFNALLALSALGSGHTMYLLARATLDPARINRWNGLGAILSGIAYMYFPYRVSEVYQRGAIGEALFFPLAPLFILAAYRILFDGINLKRFLTTSAIFGIGLLTYHLQIILVGFFGGLWLLIMLLGKYKAKPLAILSRKELAPRFFLLFGAILAGLALGAVFWLPAIVEKNSILVPFFGQYLDRDFAFSAQNLTLFPRITVESYNTNWLGFNHIIVAGTVALVVLWHTRKNTLTEWSLQIQIFYLFGILLIILYTQSVLFYEPFKLITQVLPLQFPSRLLVFGGLASAWLIGLLPSIIKGRIQFIAVIMVQIWVIVCGLINVQIYQYEPGFDGKLAPAQLAANRPDVPYLPATLQQLWEEYQPTNPIPTTDSVDRLMSIFAQEKAGSPDATALNIKTSLDKYEVEVSVSKATTLALPPFYYEGWRVYAIESSTGKERELPTFATGRIKLLGVNLPDKGDYKLIARFEDTPIRTLANWTSIISLGLWLGCSSFAGLPRRKRRIA
jgi:hypothetical protein